MLHPLLPGSTLGNVIWAPNEASARQISCRLFGNPAPHRCGSDTPLPNVDEAVLMCRSKPLAVRAERHTPDRSGVALERDQFLSGRTVPDLHRLVTASRSQALTVRAERHAVDRTGMALEGDQFLAGGTVPDLHRLIIAP